MSITICKIAIDIDGTITKNPEFFQKFINNQLKKSNEIHILTGALLNVMNDGYTITGKFYENLDCRVNQLKNIGIENWTKLISVLGEKQYPDVGNLKGQYCKDNGIDLIFEDDINYLNIIKSISPDTQTFLIT